MNIAGGILVPMTGRDPGESHRAATPLELLFDLCFVVAIAQAALSLHHAVAADHLLDGIGSYLAVFFAIWWAWMNFTWFASAYDTDDVAYRLLTLVQISGALTIAAGVETAFDGNFTVITIGYCIMRVALVTQWLRVARADHDRRAIALRYAWAIVIVQVGWLARLWLPDDLAWPSFIVLVLTEVASPVFAERSREGGMTPWHPQHIAERYGLLFIIVLGEVVLSSFAAINEAVGDDLSSDLVLTAAAALIIMFGLWWSYFAIEGGSMLGTNPDLAFTWGYVHYGLFAAVAGFGSGVAVVAEFLGPDSHVAISERGVAMAVALPVAGTMLLLTAVHTMNPARQRTGAYVSLVTAIAILAAGYLGAAGGVVLSMWLIAAAVAVKTAAMGYIGHRHPHRLTATAGNPRSD